VTYDKTLCACDGGTAHAGVDGACLHDRSMESKSLSVRAVLRPPTAYRLPDPGENVIVLSAVPVALDTSTA
jgi:hypothetical protein